MAQTTSHGISVHVDTGTFPGAEDHVPAIREMVSELLEENGCRGCFTVRLENFVRGKGSTPPLHVQRRSADNEPVGLRLRVRPKKGAPRFLVFLLPQDGDDEEKERQVDRIAGPRRVTGRDETGTEHEGEHRTEATHEQTQDAQEREPLSIVDEFVQDEGYLGLLRDWLEEKGGTGPFSSPCVIHALHNLLKEDGRRVSKRDARRIRDTLVARQYLREVPEGGPPRYVFGEKVVSRE